jgi:urea transport system substrate-binding protein
MMAWTETPVVDATVLAIEEINERGGIRGRRIEAVIADGQSNEMTFAEQAERLIATEHVAVLFGCWTSACRKAVLPIVERHDHLLFYPVQYEGLEESRNIVYTGAAPNQQIIPAVRWTFGFLRARRFLLVGWESIYSCAAHEIIRDECSGRTAVISLLLRLKPCVGSSSIMRAAAT